MATGYDESREQLDAVATDGELERNEHPIGKLVHLATVTHAFRGKLKAVTPSYYILDEAEKFDLVDSTGNFAEYLKDPKAGSAEDFYDPGKHKGAKRPQMRVLRGATSWMVCWTEK